MAGGASPKCRDKTYLALGEANVSTNLFVQFSKLIETVYLKNQTAYRKSLASLRFFSIINL